jgi:Spy/CpxP family protein refolding chaperone
MMGSSKWVLALVVAGLLAAPALAQRGGGFGGGPGMLLTNKGVQKELKLSDEQIAKVEEYSKKTRAKMQEVFKEAAGDREKMQAAFKELAQETDKFIKDNLNPEQAKRLTQIQRQQMGVGAFRDEAVITALKLTDEQKDDIKKLGDDLQAQVRELFQGVDFQDREKMQELRKKSQSIQKEALEKVTKMLSADQKKAWKDLLGEPFTVQFEGPPPGAGKKKEAGN